MVDKEKQQEELRAFEVYFPANDRTDRAIKEIKKDLTELNKIIDTEKQYQEIELILKKHTYNRDMAYSHFNNGKLYELGISTLDTLDKYDTLIKEIKEKLEQNKQSPKTKCSQCQKEITNTPINENFCSKTCSLYSEISQLLAETYASVDADKLHQLAHKLLELAQEYFPSLPACLKPYCDYLIENLQKLNDTAYETWNDVDKLQVILGYCQAKEEVVGSNNLSLLRVATTYIHSSSYLFWNGYEWSKKTIKQRIEALKSQQNSQRKDNKDNRNKDNLPRGNSSSAEINSYCDECSKEIKSERTYWYREGYKEKFCSKLCYNNYYTPVCDNCQQKCLGNSYYNDIDNKTGTICFNCNEKRKRDFQAVEEAIKSLRRELEKHPQVSWDEVSLSIENLIEELEEKQQKGRLSSYIMTKINEIRQVRQHKQRERERERESNLPYKQNKNNFSDNSSTINQDNLPNTGNSELDQHFQRVYQQNKKVFGEFSVEYQAALEQQKEIISLLSNASSKKQQKFLDLARELSPLQNKLTFNPETKTFDSSQLSVTEQLRYNRTVQEISELLAKLKQKQTKQEQKAKQTKLLIGISCGLVAIGLIGLIVWLIIKKQENRNKKV
ncbi:hypothetical protein [endosymbiont GvMRE of Glomus versiforme]|uniref:hypothetical protein n=1 Tax=endosymbiont GvMRE of Glomus versiforme TaxID=2039283 RepID=UPI000EE1DCEA|nr:hypothetical protein [endosymbiont GvMRE of Glomus versiforme]RHZ35844.1 hypothetical protein GvMRE_Ic4g129 [endosymbiont GvMRE of Glomus versiforme]